MSTWAPCVVSLKWGLLSPRGLVAGPVRASHWGRLCLGPRLSQASPSVHFAMQQYGAFHVDKLDCGQLGPWAAGAPASAPAAPEQQLHAEGSDLLYAPPYSLPFPYRYGPFPLDAPVFSGGKKPALQAKFAPPPGTPCEMARFLLSTLPAGAECQWHCANALGPASPPAPPKCLAEPPAARHLAAGYEGRYRGPRCRGEGGRRGQRRRWLLGPLRLCFAWVGGTRTAGAGTLVTARRAPGSRGPCLHRARGHSALPGFPATRA